MTADDVKGTQLVDPKVAWGWAQMVADSTPEFYIEHLKRLREHGIQAYFALGTVHQLEIVERLIRRGLYLGPMNGFFSMVGGGVCGANPFDFMELVRRTPHGSRWTYQSVMRLDWPIQAMCIALGQHCRVGIEDNLWSPKKGERMGTVKQIEKLVRISRELGREIATPEQAREIHKIGVWYNSVEKPSSTSVCRRIVRRVNRASRCIPRRNLAQRDRPVRMATRWRSSSKRCALRRSRWSE